MSAIIFTSQSLQAAKLAIVSENFSESEQGIVTYSVEYVSAPEYRQNVDRFFEQDFRPPIPSLGFDLGRLQEGNFFFVERTTREESGLVYISATYVGALNISQFQPSISSSYENGATKLYATTGYNNNSFLSGAFRQAVRDIYKMSVRTAVIQRSFSTTEDVSKVLNLPETPISTLILGARFVQRYVRGTPEKITNRNARSYQNMSAIQIIRDVARGNLNVTQERAYTYITPTVKTLTITERLSLPAFFSI